MSVKINHPANCPKDVSALAEKLKAIRPTGLVVSNDFGVVPCRDWIAIADWVLSNYTAKTESK